jgi:kynurenine formamidase
VGLDSKTVVFDSAEGLGDFRQVEASIDEGDDYNSSELKDISAHTATHVDAPSHFINVREAVSWPSSGACAVQIVS